MQLGVPVTFIAVMMKAELFGFGQRSRDVAKRYHAPLRINVYQSVRSDIYALTYEEYWAGLSASLCRNRRDRHWRAAGPRDGRPPATPPRLWHQHRESYAASHYATLRILAGIRRAAVGFDFRGTRYFRLGAVRASPHASRGLPALRVSRVLPRRMCWTAALAGDAPGA